MSTFSNNLKVLREAHDVIQAEIAEKLGITKSTWSNYEVGKSEPDIDTIVKIADALKVSVDGLLRSDLTIIAKNLTDGNLNQPEPDTKRGQKGNGKGNLTGNLKVFSEPNLVYSPVPKVVTIDQHKRDNVAFVPIKARAGYLAGYGDPEFIATLPTIYYPDLPPGTYRCFEADGVSMQPTVKHRDRFIGRYVENLAEIRDGWCYAITTFSDGIVIKRLLNRIGTDQQLVCKSDNTKYQRENGMLVIDAEDIKEVWEGYANVTRQLGEPGEVYERLNELEARLSLMEKRLAK